jgi:hypothetical protein
MEFVKNSLCLFSDKISSNVINRFDKKNIFLFENGTTYKENSMKPSAPCVGSIAYQILLLLKTKNIYLLGLDLALDSKTGKTHIDSYVDVKTVSIKEHTRQNDMLGYNQTLFSVEGNLSEKVFTNVRWQTSIDIINMSTKLLKENHQNIFNLGDGVKFTDINAKIAENIDTSKMQSTKENINEELFTLFLKNSTQNLNEAEKKSLEQKVIHAKKLLQTLKKHKKNRELSISQAIENLLKLTEEEDINKYELSRSIEIYLKFILSYVFDFANSREVENTDIHVANIYMQLTQHVEEIVNYYFNCISVRLK